MKNQLYSHYDFIVLGDHPAAIWGGSQLLEKGQKVLLIQTGVDRSRNFAPQYALASLGLEADDFVNRDMDPIQIVTSERRFRMFASADAFSDEYEFVFGGNVTDSNKIDPQLIRGMAYLYRTTETGDVPRELLPKLFQGVQDMVYFKREPGWLNEKLIEQFQKLGGHVLPANSLHRIFVEKKSFVGVQVEGSSSMITGGRAWVASLWNALQALMSEGVEERSAPISWEFEMKVRVSEEAVPLGLSSQMIWLQPNAPVIEIEHFKKGEFVLRTTLPYQEMTLDRTYQRKVSQRLLKVIAHLIPDLEYNLSRVSPDIRDPERTEQVDLVSMYPFHRLEQIPVGKLRYGLPGLGGQTSIQGMGIVYEEAFPHLGEWGAYQSAQQLIQEWSKIAQKLESQRPQATP